MNAQTVHVDGLIEALDLETSFSTMLDDTAAELTTDHAAASYGLPVLVKDGQAYGPADLPNVTVFISNASDDGAALISSAMRAGWRVRIADVR